MLPASGLMVFVKENRPKRGAPNGCYHLSTPTAFTPSLTITAWWAMRGCFCPSRWHTIWGWVTWWTRRTGSKLATRGEANLGEVAQLIRDARMSESPRNSIRATLSHFVTDHDDWSHISRDRAELLTFGPTPDR